MRKSPTKPTSAELAILNVLWERGRPSTVRQIWDVLGDERSVGYSTILKLLQIMTEKGLVDRDESERSHTYSARFTQTATQKLLLDELMEKAFGGSASRLVMRVLSDRRTNASEMREIEILLKKMRGQRK
jgi:predicted transcriptional regulator